MKIKCIFLSACLLMGSAALQAQMDSRVNQYLEDAQKIYRLNDEALNYIWEAYCRRYDLTLEEDKKYANEVAKEWQLKEKSQFDDLMSRGDNLIYDLQALMNDPDQKSNAEKWLDQVKREKEIIKKLDEGVALKGANHPFVQYATEYGKRQHDDLADDYPSPRVYDKDYGSGIRPDLVFVDGSNGLYVLEFKPDNSDAKSLGESQLDKYVPMVKDYYERCFASGRMGDANCSNSDLCPSGFLEKLKNCDSCWESDNMHLKVQRKVVTYGPCDKKF